MEKHMADLLKSMTLEEKISLLAGADFWHTRSIQRLKIPSLKVTDGPHGCRTISDSDPDFTIPATCFPTGVGIAATWNIDLVFRVGQALGKETRERGCAVILGPCVNIHRSPLGGRNFESFSEDPYLSSEVAIAYIQGVQSQKVGTCIKHFALNNSEFERFTISSEASDRAMREIYFPSFEKAVKIAKPWTAMCSYNKVNGTYASENRRLLTEILRKEWGFEGLIMSDWFATHSTAPVANAGLDLEMPDPARFFGVNLLSEVTTGEVNEQTIDEKVARILEVIRKSGSFDKPIKFSRTVFSAVMRNSSLARKAAEESIVLLKNENHVLPLKPERIKTLAVIGPNAAAARIEGGGSSAVKPYYELSPLMALQNLCPASMKLDYEPGCTGNRLMPLLDSRMVFQSPKNHKHGLIGEYFCSLEFTGKPKIRKLENKFTFRWHKGSFPENILDVDSFSARWSGIFVASESGLYRFGLQTEGRGRIYIENTLIVDRIEAPLTSGFDLADETVGEYPMEAGKSYSIRIEYSMNPLQETMMINLRIGCQPPVPEDMIQKAAALAARSDAALVFVGLNDEWESEGFDRADMLLPAPQNDLIRAIAAVNPNTIVILNNGSPVDMSSWIDDVPAVLEAWYPGMECGRAITHILMGNVNPSGKLPDTFPKRLEDNPAYHHYPGSQGKVEYGEEIFVGYRHYDRRQIEPRFPFGHGLSYTTFEYSQIRLSTDVIKMDESLAVNIDVKNTGRRSGKEVVQLYIHDIHSGLPRPPQELKGFQKVTLKSGETRQVSFVLNKSDFSFYEPSIRQWIAEPGEFEILIGSSSRDIRSRAMFHLQS